MILLSRKSRKMALKYTKKGEKMKKKQKESAYTLMYAFLALILILFVMERKNNDVHN